MITNLRSKKHQIEQKPLIYITKSSSILHIFFRSWEVTALLLLVALIVLSPYYMIQGTGIYHDLNSRVNIHNPYISLYSFWWTSTTYLSSLLWLLWVCVSLGFTSRNISSTVGNLSWVWLLSTEIVDFTFINKGWDQSNYVCEGLNTLLLNSLNHYHPFILYSSFAILTVTFFTKKDQELWLKSYSYALYENSNQTLSRISLTINILALALGSWWAAQEGTWGGWWNWDTSEVLGWLISLYTLTTLHSLSGNKCTLTALYKNLFLWKSTLFVYLLVQVSFELTTHNFGIKFFYFFNNNLFLLELLCYIFTSLVYTFNGLAYYNNSIWTWESGITLRKYPCFLFKTFLRLLLVMVITIIIVLSSKQLLSYLMWTFMSLNYSTMWVTNFMLTFSLIFYTYALLSQSEMSNHFINLFYTVIVCSWSWMFLLQLRVVNLLYLEHWLILLFTALNWSVLFHDFSYWSATSAKCSYFFKKPLGISQDKLLLLDAQTLEYAWNEYTLLESYTDGWLMLLSSNSSPLNAFSLELTHYTMWNVYCLSDTYVFTRLYLELPLTPYISVITIIATINYVCLWRTN